MKITYLGNGSSGNSTHVSDGTTSILIDNGLPLKKVSQVNGGILVTHGHSDHISGIERYCKKYNVKAIIDPSFMLEEKINELFLQEKNFREGFSIGTLRVQPFDVWHDVPCYGFIINEEYIHLTDTGKIPFTLIRHIEKNNIKVLYIESNYDEDLMENSSYDPLLIARIKGPSGHLSNQDVTAFIEKNSNILDKLENIVIGHLSESNNTPEILQKRIDENITTSIKNKVIIGKEETNIEIS